MWREIAGRRMILRHRDLVAEMFGCVVSPTHRPALRGGTHVHTHTRVVFLSGGCIRVYPHTRLRIPGDATAPVCSRCQTLWRLGVLQAMPFPSLPSPPHLLVTSSFSFSSLPLSSPFCPLSISLFISLYSSFSLLPFTHGGAACVALQG